MNNLSDNDINNDINKGVEKALEMSSLSIFNSDPYFNFVYKKSERLCMAIYLISDFFPANDSIKDNIRKCGTGLIKVSLSLITSSSSYRKDVLNDISRLCLEIVSLSKIASNLGMTSLPNHNVLEAEIKNFMGVIEAREMPGTLGQEFVLNKEVFVDEDEAVLENVPSMSVVHVVSTQFASNQSYGPSSFEIEEKAKQKEIQKIMKPDVSINTEIEKTQKTEAVNEALSLGIKSNFHSSGAVNSTNNPNGSIGVNGAKKSVMQKNERQQIILDIIKEIGESSIKDISDNIKDCSEKTIQRELNTLIYDGVLKKIGERRWSKYVLN